MGTYYHFFLIHLRASQGYKSDRVLFLKTEIRKKEKSHFREDAGGLCLFRRPWLSKLYNVNILTLPSMGLLEQPKILGGHNVPHLLVMHDPLVLS